MRRWGSRSPPRGTATSARWRAGVTAVLWLALVGATAGAAGVALATARLATIDAGALRAEPGSRVRVRGFVVAVPRRADGEVDVRVDTPAGRLLVEAPEPLPDLDIGAAVSATGTLRAPSEFEAPYLRRLGIERVLSTRSIELGGPARGGVSGTLDRVRVRAQDALGAGTPEASAALLRGFVLGQDDRIDPGTSDRLQAVRARAPACGVAARTSSCSRSSAPRRSPCSGSALGPGSCGFSP